MDAQTGLIGAKEIGVTLQTRYMPRYKTVYSIFMVNYTFIHSGCKYKI